MIGRSKALLFAAALLVSAPAAAQRGGQLISAEPMLGSKLNAKVWRVRYWTTNDRGAPMQVTGMVVAPRGEVPRDGRRIIAWTHGTSGVAESCAPSLTPKFFDLTPALDAVARGYVVVAPDYPGLGSKGPHPYLVGTITARSVLDGVRAAREIKGAGIGDRFAVWGESQGGHAALWTGQMVRDAAPELKLVGVAAGAPVTDLAANFRENAEPNAKALLTAFTLDSWSQYYHVPLVIGRRTTPGLIRRMAQPCLSLDSKPKVLTVLGILTLRRDLKGVDLAALRPWSSFVTANSTSPISFVPVLIAQARADPLVAPAVTRRFARRLCANRVAVKWIDLPGKNHMTTARDSATETLKWIDDRFAGVRAPSDCGKI
jgi:acetyl esterase/lipase